MRKGPVRKFDLSDGRQDSEEREYWRRQSGDEKLSALEELRRQYGLFTRDWEYDGARDFEEFFASCKKHGVEYLVVGGYAFAYHAHPRFTGDIDVFVRPSEENARLVIRALADFGFDLESLTWKDLAAARRVIQLGDPPLRIDIMTAIDGVTFDGAWSRKVASRFGGQEIHLISREDLIANKRASGRKQDLLDLEHLL